MSKKRSQHGAGDGAGAEEGRCVKMAIAIGLLVITNLFTGYLLLGTHYRFKALVLYIVKKGYTPPTKDDLTECIKECVREKL